MLRGPLSRDDYIPHFAGHETFPLRYGWLKKAFDAVQEAEGAGTKQSVFADADAIARFGVGKNMVSSIRHWAKAAGVLAEDVSRTFSTTALGRLLFGKHGLDPYMEHPASSWLVHWQLCGQPQRTTWFWAFSHHSTLTFNRASLSGSLEKLARDRNWKRASKGTIDRDVACLARTYASRLHPGRAMQEEDLESPLTELGLIRTEDHRDSFRLVRGPKPTLGLGVFCFAVTDFWNRQFASANTLSFEALALEPGSPGKVFLLEENDVSEMSAELEELSGGLYRWSESAGFKHLSRTSALNQETALGLLRRDYADSRPAQAAT